MAKTKLSGEMEKLLALLHADEKDALYKRLRYEHVSQDVLSFANKEDREVSEETAKVVAERYVYDERYDGNLPYWENIKALIDEQEG